MKAEKYSAAALTDRGKVRKSNQDAVLALHRRINETECVMLAVADGMGGLQHGERASRLVISALSDWFDTRLEPMLKAGAAFEQIGAAITEFLRRTHVALANEPERTGTTVSAMLVCGDRYLTLHAGDSRIYRSCEDMLFQVTTDDTWVYHAFINGIITAQEMPTHKYRHALVNAVGIGQELTVQRTEGIIESGERYLICSDGLYNELTNRQIGAVLNRSIATEEKARSLMDAVLSGSAGDNISIVLLEQNF